MKQTAKNAPPWDKKAPKKTKGRSLSAAEKSEAKTRAKKAGRPYPNLVDNMAVSKKRKKGDG